MRPPAGLADALAAALGGRVTALRPVSGGDINLAFEARLDDARVVFVKANADADGAMFPAEARGLAWLGEAGALRVPRVLAVSAADAPPDARFLALEYLASARRRADYDERLGRGLAALHRFGAPGFGLDHDNFIGRLPQANAALPSWPDFYWQRRLAPQMEMAARRGLASPAMRRGIERLGARLPELTGPAEPPARLHGDLWGGNQLVDESGAPCLIDPAAHGGHREVDLAMMRLFGGYGPRVFAAYDEACPLAPGHDERVPLYQLYFLLAHVNLFGGSYVSAVESALGRLV